MFRDKFEKCSSSRLRDPPVYASYDGPCGQDPGLYFEVIRARESLLYVAKAFEGSRHIGFEFKDFGMCLQQQGQARSRKSLDLLTEDPYSLPNRRMLPMRVDRAGATWHGRCLLGCCSKSSRGP